MEWERSNQLKTIHSRIRWSYCLANAERRPYHFVASATQRLFSLGPVPLPSIKNRAGKTAVNFNNTTII
jgi:hypothetical protein